MNKKAFIQLSMILILSSLLIISLFYLPSVSAPVTRLQELITLSSSAIDVGVYTNQGVKLDWSENGPLHRCLEIDINRTINSSNLSLLLKETNFNTNSEVKNIKLEKYTNQSYQEDIYNTFCNPYDITNPNSSITTIQNCSQVFAGTETKYKDIWNSANLIASESQSDARFDSFNHLGTGKYRYCFDVPIKQNGNGFGNKGTLYLELDNNLYVDRQGSSWWNESFPYRRALIINTSSEQVRKYYTSFVSGFNTADSNKFNNSDPNNFFVICDGIEVDKVIGNETDLKKDRLTKLFPDSTGWFTTNTSFMFRIPQNISINQYNNTLCYIYYGNLGYTSTKNNKSNIALLYDDFNRPNSTTLNNGWVEGTGTESGDQSSLEIGDNQATVRFADNGAANKVLDIGSCSDCEKWEILFEETQKGTDGDTFYITFSNTYQPDPNVQAALSGAKGVYFYHSNGNYFAIRDMASTILKKGNLVMYNQIPIAHNILALDDTNIGHFIDYFNNTLLTWDITDLNDTTVSTGNKTAIKLIGQRKGDSLNYIMIKRYMTSPPTVTLGIEEALNTPPLISQIILTPLSPVTTDDLNCTIQAIDNEQLNLFANISWYNNSILKFTFPNQPITNGTLTSFYLSNANTTKNESWSCSAAVFDGALWSGINYSQGITIQNSQPTQSQPLLTATSILNSTTDNLTCYNQSTQDINNDPVTNIYNWYKNSQPLLALNMPFESLAKDYSGRNNSGTINGPVFIQGKTGNALSFDGIDDYVDVNSATLNQDFSAITIEAWVYANSIPSSGEGLLSKTNLNYGLTYYTDGNVWAYINGGGNSIHTPLTTQTWHHLVETFDGTYIKLYVDGIEKASKLSTYPTTGTGGTFRIGRSYSGGFNGTIDEVKVYPYALSEKQVKQRYDETKDGLTTNSTIAAEETTPGDSYLCQVTPNDGIVDGVTLNSSEAKILWKIIFNVTSGEDGSQLSNFNINCNNSFTKTGANSPYSAGFLPGSYECNFTKTDFYNKTIAFTADSDKIINIRMSSKLSLTVEEHNQLQAIYDCLINGNCEAYNLWKNINKTVFEIWKHELRTDRAVVTNEAFNSRNLSTTQNISINYTINIPFKAGYAQGDLLPLRMFFWFHNGLTCYSQDKTTSNRAEAPFCIPLVAETLGPNNGTVTFTADLRPNLTAGTYNITRSIEIDPLFNNKPVWINYGQEIIGNINVQESIYDQPSININQKSLGYPEIKSYLGAITGGTIRDLLTTNISNSFLVLFGMMFITIIFVSYFKYRHK